MARKLPPPDRILELLDRTFAGDRRAAEVLCREVLIPIVDAAVSSRCHSRAESFHTRDEWSQIVFLHVYENDWAKLRHYDPSGAPFVAWLITVTANKIEDVIRKRDPPRPTEDIGDPLSRESDPEGKMLQKEVWGRVLAALDPEEILLFRWLYVDGLTRQQIADRLGRPMHRVYREIHAMEKKVKDILENPQPPLRT